MQVMFQLKALIGTGRGREDDCLDASEGLERQKRRKQLQLLITAEDSRRKPQGSAAKAIVNCSSRDHRKRLTTEAARIRSKSNRHLFTRRSPQKTHDRSRKDSQQKQSLVVCQAITAKDSRQKPQGFAAKAIVNCSSRDHRKRLTTEAARIRSKSNRWLFGKRLTTEAARIRSKSNRWLFVTR